MGKFKLIDSLEPAGDFKIAQSKDIAYNGVSVEKALNDQVSTAEQVEANTAAIAQNTADINAQSGKIETLTGKVTAAETAIAGKASQSEVDSIKTDVAGKASQTEVETIKTDVAGKASAESVTQLQTDMSVQTARMDQLVGTVPAGSADEIADARVTADGKTEANLGNAIRSQVTSLKETISRLDYKLDIEKNLFTDFFARNKIPTNSGTLGDKPGFSCIKINVKELGGKFRTIRWNYSAYKVSVWKNGVYDSAAGWAYGFPNASDDAVDYIIVSFDDSSTNYNELMFIGFVTDDKAMSVNALDDATYVKSKYILTDVEKLNSDVDTLKSKTDSLIDLTELFGAGFNKFDIKKLIPNKVSVSNASYAIGDKEGYATTGLIKLDSDKMFIRSSKKCYRIQTYDDNFNQVKLNSDDVYGIVLTPDAKYVCFNYDMSTTDFDSLMIAYTEETSGSWNNTWKAQFGTDYYPYEYDSLLALKNKHEIEKIKNPSFDIDDLISVFPNLVVVDNDGEKTIRLEGDGTNKVWHTISLHCKSLDKFLVEFTAKCSADDNYEAHTGCAIDFMFYDKNGVRIGNTKYNMSVCSIKSYGYHKYNLVTPKGTRRVDFRIFTRGETIVRFKKLNIRKVDVLPNRGNNGVIYDCHLGCLNYAPQNTMIAYEMAKMSGYDNLIINIKSTKDGKLVAIHNSTIDATSNGSGNVSSYTYAELTNYDFGSWFSPHYIGEDIPLVENVLAFLSASGMGLVVSLHSNHTRAELELLHYFVVRYGLTNNCMLKSYSTAELDLCKEIFGDHAVYDFIIGDGSLTDEITEWISGFGPSMRYIEVTNYPMLTAEYVDSVKALGCEVVGTMTMIAGDMQKAIKNGVTRFTSDCCADMVVPFF